MRSRHAAAIPFSTPFAPFFLFNPTAPTQISTLSLHDALPISPRRDGDAPYARFLRGEALLHIPDMAADDRSEEHTSELQSLTNLVCRLLLEKKKRSRHERKTKYRTH